uniref:Uncharacterized protein n=1 Tax=Anguilla anguilla TaxID=7936 RepID=A0A0E9SXW0_ANGAN
MTCSTADLSWQSVTLILRVKSKTVLYTLMRTPSVLRRL